MNEYGCTFSMNTVFLLRKYLPAPRTGQGLQRKEAYHSPLRLQKPRSGLSCASFLAKHWEKKIVNLKVKLSDIIHHSFFI